MLSTHTKNRIAVLIDQATGLGLKFGVPIAVLGAAFLLATMFGGHLRAVDKMAAQEKAYLVESVKLAAQALRIAGVALIVSLVLRLSKDEVVGQALSLVGAALYFGSAALFAGVLTDLGPTGTGLLALTVAAFRAIGGVALVVGLVLVLRDALMRIWTGISVRRVMDRRWGDEEERSKRHRKPVLLCNCWDMSLCRDFVRKVCPAYEAKKPCWRLKVGCYCDENTILRALTSQGSDNQHVRGIMSSLGLDKPERTRESAKLRRARCRRCSIYAERQRQKYRVLSPMVFPVVLALLYAFYGPITSVTWAVLQKMDRFMSILAYKSLSAGYTPGDDGRVLTTLAVIWLTIIAISYALRAVEYAVFELQM